MVDRQVSVKVVRGGRVVKRIERPLRVVDDRNAVVFKHKLWLLREGDRIDIDGSPIAWRPGVDREDSKPRARLITGKAGSRAAERTEKRAGSGAAASVSTGAAEANSARSGGHVGETNYSSPAGGSSGRIQDSSAVSRYGRSAAELGRADSGPIELSDEQKAVAYAEPSARILVEAGPGTGKTETVAHRLVNLIEQGLKPSQILVLSFSRNAVKTLAARIEGMQNEAVRQVEELRYLSVRTFDSWTFRMLRQLNYQPGDLLRRDYESNINELIGQLSGEQRGAIRDLLHNVRHVIVDEFQDLSGVRGSLVIELLKSLAPPGQKGVGFTVLGDPAQAIYGFALRNGMEQYRALTSGALVAALRELYQSDAEVLSLDHNFRAQGKLGSVMTNLRRLLLRRASGQTKFKSMVAVTSRIKELEGELAPEVLLGANVGSAAVLTSTNGEAIRVAQKLVENADALGVSAVRLHTQSQSVVVPAWVGATLGRLKDTTLSRSQFVRIYSHLYCGVHSEDAKALEVPPLEVAWARLARATGVATDATSLDIAVLRSRLGWPDLLPDDEGVQKASLHVMTIHQSKGMEFDSVAIMTDSLGSRKLNTEAEEIEAANVIFVGMTRAARQLFRVGSGQTYGPLRPREFDGDRKRWYSWRYGWVNIEAGIPGDVNPAGFIDRRVFGADGDSAPESIVAECQDFLATHAASLRGRKVMLCRWPMPGERNKFVYRIHLQENDEAGRILGVTTHHLTLDLLHLIWDKGYSLPGKIFNLRISDVVTIGRQQELPESAAQPWSGSGLWLGVNLYGTGDFKTFKRR